MTIRRVTSPTVPEPPPERWSNCLVSDGIAYVSGMTCRGVDDKKLAAMDEYEQAKVIFGKIKGMVEAAGGAMADVVKITVYVTNIKNNVTAVRQLSKQIQLVRIFVVEGLQRPVTKQLV